MLRDAMYKFHESLLILGISFLLLSSSGQGGLLRKRVLRSTEISQKCHFCMGEEKGQDNIEACSVRKDLDVENCPIDDHFDKCIVFQAFSKKLNTTIFKRECTSERFCTSAIGCNNPDYVDCRFECCTGDLCNDFDFKTPLATKVPQVSDSPEVKKTSTENEKTPSYGPNTDSSRLAGPTIRRETPTRTIKTNENSDCYDIDKMCTKYSSNPEFLTQYCIDEKPYMMLYCRKTCKFCHMDKDLVTKQPTIQPTTKENYSEECIDKDPNCRTYVPNPMYLPTFCIDNKDYTSVVCRKTCNFCGRQLRPTENTILTSVPEEKTTLTSIPGDDCQDTHKDCTKVTSPQYCLDNEKLMKTLCRRSCGYCTIGVAATPTSMNETCKDTRDECALLAKNTSFCVILQWFVEINCRKSCNLCTEDPTPISKDTTSLPPISKGTTGSSLLGGPTPISNGTTAGPTPISKGTTGNGSSSLGGPTPKDTIGLPLISNSTTGNERSTLVGPTITSKGTTITSKGTTGPTPTSKGTTGNESSTLAGSTAPTSEGTTGSTAPTSEGTTDCKDNRKRCAYFAAYPGYCDYNRWFMIDHCPKSCNFCSEGISKTTKSPLTESVTKSPSTESLVTPFPSTKSSLTESPPTVSNHTESVTTSPPTVSNHTESVTTSPPTVSNHTESVTTSPPTVSNHTESVTTSPPTVSPVTESLITGFPFPNEGNGGQHGITNTNSPETLITNGAYNLRWIVEAWGECVDGKQFRPVHCYHFYDGKYYQVAIRYCIEHVSGMVSKEQSC